MVLEQELVGVGGRDNIVKMSETFQVTLGQQCVSMFPKPTYACRSPGDLVAERSKLGAEISHFQQAFSWWKCCRSKNHFWVARMYLFNCNIRYIKKTVWKAEIKCPGRTGKEVTNSECIYDGVTRRIYLAYNNNFSPKFWKEEPSAAKVACWRQTCLQVVGVSGTDKESVWLRRNKQGRCDRNEARCVGWGRCEGPWLLWLRNLICLVLVIVRAIFLEDDWL